MVSPGRQRVSARMRAAATSQDVRARATGRAASPLAVEGDDAGCRCDGGPGWRRGAGEIEIDPSVGNVRPVGEEKAEAEATGRDAAQHLGRPERPDPRLRDHRPDVGDFQEPIDLAFPGRDRQQHRDEAGRFGGQDRDAGLRPARKADADRAAWREAEAGQASGHAPDRGGRFGPGEGGGGSPAPALATRSVPQEGCLRVERGHRVEHAGQRSAAIAGGEGVAARHGTEGGAEHPGPETCRFAGPGILARRGLSGRSELLAFKAEGRPGWPRRDYARRVRAGLAFASFARPKQPARLVTSRLQLHRQSTIRINECLQRLASLGWQRRSPSRSESRLAEEPTRKPGASASASPRSRRPQPRPLPRPRSRDSRPRIPGLCSCR